MLLAVSGSVQDEIRLTKDDLAHVAARRVAVFWCKSAASIIARGASPTKLSPLAIGYVREELDEDIYQKFAGKYNVKKIAEEAIEEAKLLMRSKPEFHSVMEYFNPFRK